MTRAVKPKPKAPFRLFMRNDSPYWQVIYHRPDDSLNQVRRSTRRKIRASAEMWAQLSLRHYARTGLLPGTKIEDIGLKADHA